MKRARWLLAVGLAHVLACANLLGGLDDGIPRPIDASAPSPSSGDGGCLAYRRAYEIQNSLDVPLADYSLRLNLDTHALIDAGKLGRDGHDLRLVGNDGTTILPASFPVDLDNEATTLWARATIPAGLSRVFVDYGNSHAAPSSSDHVFLDTIVANARFDDGTAPWIGVPASDPSTSSSLSMTSGGASVLFKRSTGSEPNAIGWCQTVTFPAEGPYRLVIDARIDVVYGAALRITLGGVSGTVVWTADEPAFLQGVESDLVPAGTTQLCLGAAVTTSLPGQNISGVFNNLRVRHSVATEPAVGLTGPEQSACAPATLP